MESIGGGGDSDEAVSLEIRVERMAIVGLSEISRDLEFGR